MCVELTPPMSAATAETASSSAYHALSTGSADSANDAVASLRNRLCVVGVEAAVRDRPIGKRKQLRREQRAPGQERVQSRLQLGREEPAVVGDQHRGEHAERVAGQLVGRDRTEGRAHHRHRGRAPPRAGRSSRPGACQAPRRSARPARSSSGVPTRIAPCRSAVTRSIEPSRCGRGSVAGDHFGVHLGGDLDAGSVYAGTSRP